MTPELRDRAERAAASIADHLDLNRAWKPSTRHLVQRALVLGWLAGHEAGRIDGISYAIESFPAIMAARS